MRSKETLIRAHRFLLDEKARDVAQIETMIADFELRLLSLENQIEAEQQSSGIYDVTHFAYPTAAKAAMTRCERLRSTIHALCQQLELAQEKLANVEAELKRVELIDEGEDRDRRSHVRGQGFDKANIPLRGA